MATIHILPTAEERKLQRYEALIIEALAHYEPGVRAEMEKYSLEILRKVFKRFEIPITIEGDFTEEQVRAIKKGMNDLLEGYQAAGREMILEMIVLKHAEICGRRK
jgi:hypothetical protein